MTPTASLTTAAEMAREWLREWILDEADVPDNHPEMVAALEAVLTTYAAQVRRAQWQDIATAPKDGTRVLIASLGGIGTGYWGKSAADHEPGWSDGGAYFIEATHWQPLPSPPGSPSSQTDTGDSNG